MKCRGKMMNESFRAYLTESIYTASRRIQETGRLFRLNGRYNGFKIDGKEIMPVLARGFSA